MIIKKFTPLNKNILVKLLETEGKTDSGIYLPDDAKSESKFGEVIATYGEKSSVKVGDTVMFSTYANNNLEIDEKNHLVLDEKDLLGKVE